MKQELGKMVISYEFEKMWFWAICRFCPVIRLLMRKSTQKYVTIANSCLKFDFDTFRMQV
jgi:hypothetical protein